LRCQGTPQACAVDGLLYVPRGVGALQSVGRGSREQTPDRVAGELSEEAIEVLVRQAGSCGVVNQDPIIAARVSCEHREAIADGVAALLAAGGHEDSAGSDGDG